MTAVMEDVDVFLAEFGAEDFAKPCEGLKHIEEACSLEAVCVSVWDVHCEHLSPETYHCAGHRDKTIEFAAGRPEMHCVTCHSPVALLRIEPIK